MIKLLLSLVTDPVTSYNVRYNDCSGLAKILDSSLKPELLCNQNINDDVNLAKFLECSSISKPFDSNFAKFLECSLPLESRKKCYETVRIRKIRDVTKCYEMFGYEIVTKCYEMLRNVTKCYEKCYEVLKMIRILLNFSNVI